MARDNKVRMPSSSAGITQYFDEVKARFTLKPMHVVIIGAVVVVAIIILEL